MLATVQPLSCSAGAVDRSQQPLARRLQSLSGHPAGRAKSRFCVSLLGLVSSAACSVQAAEPPEIILHNAKIYTVNEHQPWAQALAIDAEGRIVAVGSEAEVLPLAGRKTEQVDLNGRLVLPGFQDTHAHVIDASSEAQAGCELSPEDALDDWLGALTECAKGERDDQDDVEREDKEAEPVDEDNDDSSDTGWLLGSGFSLHTLLESEESPRSLLDHIIPDRPVAIMEEMSHSYWLNSAALRLAGIDADTVDPVGGVIIRDRNRQPTGLLLENAGDLAVDVALPPSRALHQTYYDAVVAGQDELAKNGITSVADARVFWRRGHLGAWQDAAHRRKLKARTVLDLWAYPSLHDDEQLDALKALHDDDGSDLLRVTQVKFYVDGIIHNTTARLREPYKESLPRVDQHGLYYFDPTRLALYARELSAAGFDLHIHAIGDQGVRDALDAIESAGDSGRHRITHVELVDPQDILRFRALNVIADFQPSPYFQEQALEEYEPAIGERAQQLLPMRAIYDSGARVTLSSDWDVNPLSPLGIIRNSLSLGERSLPSLEAAVRAYTLNAAYTLRQESETGSLEVGKQADLIVLDRNIFELPVEQIDTVKVVWTLLAGEEVYRDSSFAKSP